LNGKRKRTLHSKGILIMALLVTGLPACSTLQEAKVDHTARDHLYETRLDIFGGIDSWVLEGRLAVSNDEDGGSGHFSWNKQGESHRMDFHGALGRGAWRLESDSSGAQLELADGTTHRARTIGELVRRQVGWEIPLDALAWWVRGLAAPGVIQHRELDEEGRLVELLQRDWTIEYGRYRAVGNLDLPIKLTAHQAENTVKLAIRNWQIPKSPEKHE